MSCQYTQILAAAQNYLVMNPFRKQIENNKMLCFWILAHLAGGAFISEWNKLESNYCFNCELCLVMEFILSIYLIKIYLGGKNILCNCQLQQTKGTVRLWIGSCLQETTAPFLSYFCSLFANWLYCLTISHSSHQPTSYWAISNQLLILAWYTYYIYIYIYVCFLSKHQRQINLKHV